MIDTPIRSMVCFSKSYVNSWCSCAGFWQYLKRNNMLLGFLYHENRFMSSIIFFFWKVASVSVYRHWCNQFTNMTDFFWRLLLFFVFFWCFLTNTLCCWMNVKSEEGVTYLFQANSVEMCLLRLSQTSPLVSGFISLILPPKLYPQTRFLQCFMYTG